LKRALIFFFFYCKFYVYFIFIWNL